MEFHEMKEETWIHYENEYHYVYEDNGNFFEILTSAWSPETRQSLFETEFPIDAKIVEPPKYQKGQLVFYKGLDRMKFMKPYDIKIVFFDTNYIDKIGTIDIVQLEDKLYSYRLYFPHHQTNLWATPYEVEPVDY